MDIEERRRLFMAAVGKNPDENGTADTAGNGADADGREAAEAAGKHRSGKRGAAASETALQNHGRGRSWNERNISPREKPDSRRQNSRPETIRGGAGRSQSREDRNRRRADSFRYYRRYLVIMPLCGAAAVLMAVGLISVASSNDRSKVADGAGNVEEIQYVMTAADSGSGDDSSADAAQDVGASAVTAASSASSADNAASGTTAAAVSTAAATVSGGVDISNITMPSWIQVDLIRPNPYSRPMIPLQSVDYIVIHWVANAGTTAEANRNYFDNLGNPDDPYYADRKASAHFVVGLDGEVIQCVPLNELAYAQGDEYNPVSISIEVCHAGDEGEFSETTRQGLDRLTAWLMQQFDVDIDHVLRHYDCTGKDCPKYYVDETRWAALKSEIEAYYEANPSIG